MDFSKMKKLVIPEGDVQQIKDMNGNVLWEKPPAFVNQIPKSIGTDGKPYNNGLGYKAQTRISSSTGAESTAANGTVTGFIKAKAKDVIRIWEFKWGGVNASSSNIIVVYNSNFAYIGSAVHNGTQKGAGASTSIELSTSNQIGFKNATVTLTDNADIAYIRVCSYGNNGNSIPDGAADAIITVNEEII